MQAYADRRTQVRTPPGACWYARRQAHARTHADRHTNVRTQTGARWYGRR